MPAGKSWSAHACPEFFNYPSPRSRSHQNRYASPRFAAPPGAGAFRNGARVINRNRVSRRASDEPQHHRRRRSDLDRLAPDAEVADWPLSGPLAYDRNRRSGLIAVREVPRRGFSIGNVVRVSPGVRAADGSGRALLIVSASACTASAFALPMAYFSGAEQAPGVVTPS